MLSISIIIPAYNESATIIALLGEVRAQRIDGVTFEIIVIDDGSKDNTVALLEQNPGLYDRLIVQPRNGGKGAAVLAGLRAATGDYILFQDADLEYSPTEYAAMIFPITAFGAEVVMGSRFAAPRYTRIQYFSHKIGNKLITLTFNVLFNATFTDIYSCYLLYKRDLVAPDELVSFGWEQHAEILCRAVRRAKVMYEIPISYHGRSYEEGKKIRARHVIPVVGMLFRRWLSK
jgi:glycosyltransferase involved in cell wall biosynthesis